MSRRPARQQDDGSVELTLREERLRVGTTAQEQGRVRVVKHVETETVREQVPRAVEHAEVERQSAVEGDSGQVETLPDGSLSIPVFEEQIVIEKRLVVRERVIVRKQTVYEDQVVTADLKRERVEFETDGDVGFADDEEPADR